MASLERISRKQRLKFSNYKKSRIALVMAIVLILLAVGNHFRRDLKSIIIGNLFAKSESEIAALADTLAFSIGGSFQLSEEPSRNAEAVRPDSVSFPKFIQPWPRELPFVYYVRRLKDRAAESGFNCRFLDFGDSLACFLLYENIQSAEIILRPRRNVSLKNRSVGIILKNINSLENHEIMKLLESDIPFGYYANVDIYPAGDVRKRFASSNTYSILILPSSGEKIISLDIRDRAGKKLRDKELASEILGRHPNLRVIGFVDDGPIDLPMVGSIIEQAKTNDLGYLYSSSTPLKADSLAYIAGLTFLSNKDITDYTVKESPDVKQELLGRIIGAENRLYLLVTLDVSGIQIDDFIDLANMLDDAGINLFDYNELISTGEFIVKDL